MVSHFEFGGVVLEYIRHAGFKVKGTKVIYLDPYQIPKNMEKADLILVTHDHYDHLDLNSIKQIYKEDTVLVAPEGCKLKEIKIQPIKIGQELSFGSVKVKAVPAYNLNKPYHKKGMGVGYVVDIDGVRIYHAGDTDRIPEMKEISVDIALLPVGGTYTMDLKEAIAATKDIKAEFFIPMHYGAIPNTAADVEKFKKEVKNAVILKPLL
ncbi:MAG: MBL fold metallo-hydrolase [Archaeoglobaceae archaeon]